MQSEVEIGEKRAGLLSKAPVVKSSASEVLEKGEKSTVNLNDLLKELS